MTRNEAQTIIASKAEDAGKSERQFVKDELERAKSVYGASRNMGVYPTTLINAMKRLRVKLVTETVVVDESGVS